MGSTTLNPSNRGFGVCSALGTACADAEVSFAVPSAVPPGASPDSALRIKSSAWAAVPVCVQLPEISRPFFFSLPSYTPPRRGTSNRTASPRSVTLLNARTACWSTLSIVPPSSPLPDLVIVNTQRNCPVSTPAHTPSIPWAESTAWPSDAPAKDKEPSAAINRKTSFDGIFMCVLRSKTELRKISRPLGRCAEHHHPETCAIARSRPKDNRRTAPGGWRGHPVRQADSAGQRRA